MEDGRVTSPSDSTEDSGCSSEETPKTRSEWFEYLCPVYMSYGMTYEEYWDGDNRLPKYYRKKHDLERKNKNFELWLQGYYYYQALCATAPILNAFSKAKEPLPYPNELLPLTKAEVLEKEERAKREQMIRNRNALQAAAEQFNREFFKKKRGGTDG